MELELRIATKADAGDIASLVNRDYRPSPHQAGWTHESHMLAGDRTNTGQVLALFDERSTILLLCKGVKIVACVQVRAVRPVPISACWRPIRPSKPRPLASRATPPLAA